MQESDNIVIFAAAASAAVVAAAGALFVVLLFLGAVGLSQVTVEAGLSVDDGLTDVIEIGERQPITGVPAYSSAVLEGEDALQPTENNMSQSTEEDVPPSVEEVATWPVEENTVEQASFNSLMEECLQNPDMPSGCEICAMTSVLHAMGYAIPPTSFADNFVMRLEGEPDMVHAYSGSPYERGAAFPPVMVLAGNTFLKSVSSEWRFEELVGWEFEDLLASLQSGCPVLVWTTMYMDQPELTDISLDEDNEYIWYSNEHCVAVYGESETGDVLVMDPLEGFVERPLEEFAKLYDTCGKHSIKLVDASSMGDTIYTEVNVKANEQEENNGEA